MFPWTRRRIARQILTNNAAAILNLWRLSPRKGWTTTTGIAKVMGMSTESVESAVAHLTAKGYLFESRTGGRYRATDSGLTTTKF